MEFARSRELLCHVPTSTTSTSRIASLKPTSPTTHCARQSFLILTCLKWRFIFNGYFVHKYICILICISVFKTVDNVHSVTIIVMIFYKPHITYD